MKHRGRRVGDYPFIPKTVRQDAEVIRWRGCYIVVHPDQHPIIHDGTGWKPLQWEGMPENIKYDAEVPDTYLCSNTGKECSVVKRQGKTLDD